MKEKPTIASRIYGGFNSFRKYLLGQSKEDIQQYSTRKLIKLLTNSAPDSDQEKMVIEAIEYRIQVNKAAEEKYKDSPSIIEALKEREEIFNKYHMVGGHENELKRKKEDWKKFQKYKEIDTKPLERLTPEEHKIRGTEYFDLNEKVNRYEGSKLMGSDSLIITAAKHGHSKVVKLLVDAGKVDMFAKRYEGYDSYGNRIDVSPLDHLEHYQSKQENRSLLSKIWLKIIEATTTDTSINKDSPKAEESSAEITRDLIKMKQVAQKNTDNGKLRSASEPILYGGNKQATVIMQRSASLPLIASASSKDSVSPNVVPIKLESFPRLRQTKSDRW